jgi:hypothetical protein
MAADCGDFTENTTRLGTWIAVGRLANATLYFVGMAMPGQFMVARTTKRGCPAQGRA